MTGSIPWHSCPTARIVSGSVDKTADLGGDDDLLLLLATQFSLRRLLSRSDGFREQIIFLNGVTVDGGDSHENTDWIKLPSASFLLGHLVDNDYSLPRGILNMQKSPKSACALNSASTFIEL